MDDLAERLLLIAAWRKPGGPTPKEQMPDTYGVATEAATRITALEADKAGLVEYIREQITHVETRLQDGIELGATVWRLALEDVARENCAALEQHGGGK